MLEYVVILLEKHPELKQEKLTITTLSRHKAIRSNVKNIYIVDIPTKNKIVKIYLKQIIYILYNY